VYLNGQFLDPFTIDPFLYDLPRAGILTLDFVSYNLPTFKHADLMSKLVCPRASTFRIKPAARAVAVNSLQTGEATAGPGNSAAAGGMAHAVEALSSTAIKKLKGTFCLASCHATFCATILS
jgi:hypothetical protein